MSRRGFCIWLTGLSGSGKSTLAVGLAGRLRELNWNVVVFDGDVVRANECKDLDFSREARIINVKRVALCAVDVVNAGGVAICALMSRYAEARQAAREIIRPERFVLIHVATPLSICERRDVKGLYARARKGEIDHFIGIDYSYEIPRDADVRLDTSASPLEWDLEAIVEPYDRTGGNDNRSVVS